MSSQPVEAHAPAPAPIPAATRKDWRKLVKKLRRKRIRQKCAKLRCEEELKREKSPTYQAWLKDQEEMQRIQDENEQAINDEQEERWMRRELVAQKSFAEARKRAELKESERRAEREILLKEFEEQQAEIRKRREERQRKEQEELERHEELIKRVREYADGRGPFPEELHANLDTKPGKELCPFYQKTNACRHGFKCLRNHSTPQISSIVVLRNFFTHISMEQSRANEYGADFGLEFTESDLHSAYEEFFNDIVPELEKFGPIENVRTCSNFEPHLRGNTFVEYRKERDALRACLNLQSRFYAGKQINAEFSPITSWKTAICGLSYNRKCPKGNNCNYIHMFRNPGNKYNQPVNRGDTSQRRKSATPSSWNMDNGTPRRNWRWSESPERVSVKDKSPRKEESRKKSKKRRKSRSRSPRNRKRDKKSSKRSKKSRKSK